MTAAIPGRVLVVGGGPAAAAAAAGLTDRGYVGTLTLVSAEPVAPYARPPMSKAYLAGGASPDDLRVGTGAAELLLGERVVAIDERTRRVRLSSDAELSYDELVFATGTRATRPAAEGVHVLETLDDADRLRTAFDRGTSAIVVGSGLLAFELASAAVGRGLGVTLVARSGALERRLGVLGGILRRLARDHGVLVKEDRGAFEEGAVMLAGGERLEADVVIGALGCTPNDELLAEHRAVGGGVVVDASGRVAPGIVAAGDVAVRRRSDGGCVRDATWTNALAQGDAAAATILGSTPVDGPEPIPYGWTEAFGLEIKVAGVIPVGVDPIVIDGDLAAGRALLQWPGAAAAVGYRIPIGRLRRLAA